MMRCHWPRCRRREVIARPLSGLRRHECYVFITNRAHPVLDRRWDTSDIDLLIADREPIEDI